jgi:hypothetical protein
MLFSLMLHADRMPSVDTVTVVCDRCGRPGWRLEVSEVSGEIVVDGARIGPDYAPLASQAGRRAHAYRLPGERAGAFILTADGPAGYGTRDKLVCIGRRHPRYERVVTRESAGRAYRAAVAAGRARIRLSEMSGRP